MKTAFSILLAIPFIVFGFNGFIQFIPVPEFHPFMQILVESGYIYLIKFVELIGGLFLLFPRTRFAGYLLIAPVFVNIAAYHVFLDPRNWPVVVVLLVPFMYLSWSYAERIMRLVLGKGD